MWSGEQALQLLSEFSASDNYDHLLDIPISRLRRGLEAAISDVFELSYGMAWIGPVGVGKTTALSLLSNLTVVDPRKGQPQPVFPATGGRTTISEVIVRAAPAFGISVEPMTEDQVRSLVTDLVLGLVKKDHGVTSEVDRALRNMADLKRGKDERGTAVDPIRELIASKSESVDDAVDEIVQRIGLPARTETQLIMSETAENGLRWVSENIHRINYGQHPRFSIPTKTTVFVPRSVLRASRFELSITDTKGLLGTTLREDIRRHLDDSRTISILCCQFNDAPGAETIKLLNDLKVMGSDALERQRVILLVLPRGDEPMKVVDDSGDTVESAEEGYTVRRRQIYETLRTEGIPELPIVFFNAMNDNPGRIWEKLNEQLEGTRQRHLERLSRFVETALDIVDNADAARIEQARVAIAEELSKIVVKYDRPDPQVRPAHQSLLEELERGHASSIAASVNRRGEWVSFSMPHMIGVGVRVDANLRTSEIFVKIQGRLESLSEEFESLPEIQTILIGIRENLEEWRQEFLARSLDIGRVAFKPYIDSASELWAVLSQFWGQGPGYRQRVSEAVRRWFEEDEGVPDARRRVEVRLEEAWRVSILDRLRVAVEASV